MSKDNEIIENLASRLRQGTAEEMLFWKKTATYLLEAIEEGKENRWQDIVAHVKSRFKCNTERGLPKGRDWIDVRSVLANLEPDIRRTDSVFHECYVRESFPKEDETLDPREVAMQKRRIIMEEQPCPPSLN